MCERLKTLGMLINSTECEQERLRQASLDSSYLFMPNQEDLYAWQVEVRRDGATFHRLFASQELALHWAASNIKTYYIVMESGYVLSNRLKDLYDSGQYSEIIGWINSHFAGVSYSVAPIRIAGSV